MSVSASPDRAASRTVVLSAPADRWTRFNVAISQLVPAGAPAIRRLDFALAYDLTPNTSRFFLDEVALVN